MSREGKRQLREGRARAQRRGWAAGVGTGQSLAAGAGVVVKKWGNKELRDREVQLERCSRGHRDCFVAWDWGEPWIKWSLL